MDLSIFPAPFPVSISGGFISGEAIFSGGAFVGELAALTAAALWAAATLMFGQLGKQLSPLLLNIVKGLFALVFIALTLIAQGQIWSVESGPILPARSIFYLLLSGGLGIGLGDTAYFAGINALGARRALLLETLAPPMTAILAWIFLAEQLPMRAIAGIAITLIGVAWVISERTPGTPQTQSSAYGLQMALLAVSCQAAGAVLSRAGLAGTPMTPLWSSLIRLSAGLVFMGSLAAIRPRSLVAQPVIPSMGKSFQPQQNRSALAVLKSPRLLIAVAITSFFATYLGIWLQQISLKYAAAGIAQALLATSPLFVLPMAALLGNRLSARAVFGVAIALSGVWLLLYAA